MRARTSILSGMVVYQCFPRCSASGHGLVRSVGILCTSYLKGFSDAIVPEVASSQEKVEAILAWMSKGPQRLSTDHPEQLSLRDPEQTLNYRQLLDVCGSATNAFLNLSRSAGLETRRLLLLTPEHTAKHVVAEVHLDGRWADCRP